MQKYTAIILASRDIGEYDRLYIMYTLEAGLVKAVARGVRKAAAKLAGHLNPMTLSEVYVARSRGRGQITSAITLRSYKNIRGSLEKTASTLKIFNFFLKKVSEEEKDEELFELLKKYLEITNEAGRTDEAKIVRESFWWKFFDLLGNRPQVLRCTKCGAKLKDAEQKYFSSQRGGTICESCSKGEREKDRISTNQIKLLRVFLGNALKDISKVKVDEKELDGLERIKNNFLGHNFS